MDVVMWVRVVMTRRGSGEHKYKYSPVHVLTRLPHLQDIPACLCAAGNTSRSITRVVSHKPRVAMLLM